MTEPSAELRELADSYNVATDWWDWQGRHIYVGAEVLVSVLGALGVRADSPDAVQQALAARRLESWNRVLPACLVVRRGGSVNVHVPHGSRVDVWIELEGGGTRSDLRQFDNFQPPRELGRQLIGEASFAFPDDLPLGYHRLKAWCNGEQSEGALIVTPAWLGFPPRMGDRRIWGFASQLYSVRSQHSWGVGDLADLQTLAAWSGSKLGADFVLINPLHAAEPVAPMEPSPYLPTTRRFANPMYLRVENVAEFADLDLEAMAEIERTRDAIQADPEVRAVVERDESWAAKKRALQLVHGAGRSPARQARFEDYRAQEGVGLTDFATWCALSEKYGSNWHLWPEGLRHPRAAEVEAFRSEHADTIDFYQWLQWLLDEQLSATQAAAIDAGMALGVVHDLAVGVHPQGSDSWSLQDVYAEGIHVGAPPDPFNQIGQDWSQPPWQPDRLAELEYAPYREMLSTILRHAGGIRVDHVIGLFRLWWIPEGAKPLEGTYVRYDHEAMIGILALEAHRRGALVVGEDLGTVEPWARDYLRERGILGTSILWFEFDEEGRPRRPEWWREYCLASVTTHDLPPTAGYLAGDHVALRQSLGLLTRSLEEEMAADAVERGAWLQELRDRHALAADAGVEQTVAALHRFLTWTPSRMLSVALTDAVGDRRTQNQPGTTDEYPNWRVPLTGPDGEPMMLEDVMASQRAIHLAGVVRG